VKKITLIIGMGTIIFACSIAQAGFVSFDCYFPDDPYGYDHNWNFDLENSELTLTESLTVLPPPDGDQVVMSGETDSDPPFTLIKNITNTTGITWTGYDLELIGNATFVNGTASSTKFNTHSFSADLKTLHFYAPQSVLDSQSVTLQVDINVPTTGLFNFTMAQHPIPEPVTIMLLGLGALGVLLKRRE
jgi:hypothetical protein